MNQEQLNEIVALHGKWLRGEEGGVRANLAGANLIGAYLFRANLARANLIFANLTDANLTEANLANADLVGANLTGVNLTMANLTKANLREVCLAEANLTEANLAGADLADADLTDADLTSADLTDVDLVGADLALTTMCDAILTRTCFSDATLNQTKGIKYWTCCPGEHVINAIEIEGIVQVWIGCKKLTLPEWIDQYRKIGEENNYTEAEIEVYGEMLRTAKHVIFGSY